VYVHIIAQRDMQPSTRLKRWLPDTRKVARWCLLNWAILSSQIGHFSHNRDLYLNKNLWFEFIPIPTSWTSTEFIPIAHDRMDLHLISSMWLKALLSLHWASDRPQTGCSRRMSDAPEMEEKVFSNRFWMLFRMPECLSPGGKMSPLNQLNSLLRIT